MKLKINPKKFISEKREALNMYGWAAGNSIVESQFRRPANKALKELLERIDRKEFGFETTALAEKITRFCEKNKSAFGGMKKLADIDLAIPRKLQANVALGVVDAEDMDFLLKGFPKFVEDVCEKCSKIFKKGVI